LHVCTRNETLTANATPRETLLLGRKSLLPQTLNGLGDENFGQHGTALHAEHVVVAGDNTARRAAARRCVCGLLRLLGLLGLMRSKGRRRRIRRNGGAA